VNNLWISSCQSIFLAKLHSLRSRILELHSSRSFVPPFNGIICVVSWRGSFREISRSNNRARGILMRLTHSSGGPRTAVSSSSSLRDHAATVVLNVTLFMPVTSAHKFQPAGLIGNADAYTDSCVREGRNFEISIGRRTDAMADSIRPFVVVSTLRRACLLSHNT